MPIVKTIDCKLLVQISIIEGINEPFDEYYNPSGTFSQYSNGGVLVL